MKKWMVRSLTAMVVAAGSLVSLAGPAQAFDRGTCDQQLGAANVSHVTFIRVDTGTAGKVDFGDLPHTGTAGPGGLPEKHAVVCWAKDGTVGVVGRVFADSGDLVTTATAQITFYDWLGRPTAMPSRTVTGNYAASTDMSHWATGRNFARVRLRLYSNGALVITTNYDRPLFR